MTASIWGQSGGPIQASNIITNIADLRLYRDPVALFQVVLGYYTAGDGGGGLYYRDATDTTTADNNGTVIVDAAGSRWKYYRAPNTALSVQVFGAIAANADNTLYVQRTLNSLTTAGDEITIPRGIKFNPKNLTFPMRSNIWAWMDDDLSRPNPVTTLGTNERIYLVCNANDDGIVDEVRFTSVFHPGYVIDLRRDIAGFDAFLGPTQKRIPDASTSAKASINIADQQVDSFRLMYEIFGGDYSNFNCTRLHNWRKVVTLTGIGTGSFVSLPAVGTLLTGTVSGARGWFLSSDATTVTILWLDGVFAVGDRITDNNETTVAAATAVNFPIPIEFPALAQDFQKGYWSISLPPGSAKDLFSVGGRIGVSKTRVSGQYTHQTINDPGYSFVESYDAASPVGFSYLYDTSVAANLRRVYKVKYGETARREVLAGPSASITFSNALTIDSEAFNIASVTRPAGGRYVLTFATQMASTKYKVQISSDNLADRFQRWTAKGLNSVEIQTFDSGGALNNLAGNLDVVIFFGDV